MLAWIWTRYSCTYHRTGLVRLYEEHALGRLVFYVIVVGDDFVQVKRSLGYWDVELFPLLDEVVKLRPWLDEVDMSIVTRLFPLLPFHLLFLLFSAWRVLRGGLRKERNLRPVCLLDPLTCLLP